VIIQIGITSNTEVLFLYFFWRGGISLHFTKWYNSV